MELPYSDCTKYHFDVMKNGKMYGMLDVNGYSGQAWYHTWHGGFIQE